MKFIWDNTYEDIGRYYLSLYDGDQKLEDIYITDYSCEFQRENDKMLKVHRDYAYVVSYCCGYSMKEGFDKQQDAYNKWGYDGTPTHTLEDIKRWCENYLAQMYLRGYYNTLKSLDERKRRAAWFESQGFKLEENID